MLADAQTYALPEDAVLRARLALGLNYPDWAALHAELAQWRARVAEEFSALLAPRRRRSHDGDTLAPYWRALPEHGEAAQLEAAGFAEPAALHASLCDFARAPGVRELSDAARARLDRVLPALLQQAAQSAQPDAVLHRVLPLLQTLLRRASYLALLDEQPAALTQMCIRDSAQVAHDLLDGIHLHFHPATAVLHGVLARLILDQLEQRVGIRQLQRKAHCKRFQ